MGHAAKRQTRKTCQVTKESLAPQWHLFSLPVGMSFYLFGESRCFILRCDIDGFMDVLRRLFPRVSISLSVCWHLCVTPLSSFSFIIVTPSFRLYSTYNFYLCFRSKRSSVPTTECIFELPHFTVQATRAQTLLLQAICQSWSHSVFNGAPSSLSENLLNEVYKAPGKGHSCTTRYHLSQETTVSYWDN